VPLQSRACSERIVFIAIGLVGGCTFSMAGGIRIQRIRLLLDAVRRKGNQPDREGLKTVLTSIVSFFVILTILTLAFSTIGVSMLDSLFEVGSAFTTNGISMGITTVAIPLGYKWLLILAMVLGRIEVVSIFRALSSTPISEVAKRLVGILRKKVKAKKPSP
jgi:Trk-type K+ transport system membrane component